MSVTLPEDLTNATLHHEFSLSGGWIDMDASDGLTGKLSGGSYVNSENSFDLVVYATTADGYSFSVRKTVNIQNDHAGGTASCTDKAVCSTCGEEYGELVKHSLVKTEAKGATCTEDGNIEYWTCSVCHKIFSDENGTTEVSLSNTVVKATGHTLNKVNAKDSTVAAVGNIEYWQCDDCDETFSDSEGTHPIELEDTVIAKIPSIIEGMNQTINAGEKKALTFRSNAEFADFLEVKIDGKTLDPKHYTAKEGSTIVTLKADYVSTLSVGTHTIGIVSEGGTAETTFTIQAKKTVDTSDRTGLLMWSGIMLMSVALITVLGAFRKYVSGKNI